MARSKTTTASCASRAASRAATPRRRSAASIAALTAARFVRSCSCSSGLVAITARRSAARSIRSTSSAPTSEIAWTAAGKGATPAAAIRTRRPAVVINLLGDYARTAAVLTRAMQPGGHYVDLAADPIAVPRLLDRNEDAFGRR